MIKKVIFFSLDGKFYNSSQIDSHLLSSIGFEQKGKTVIYSYSNKKRFFVYLTLVTYSKHTSFIPSELNGKVKTHYTVILRILISGLHVGFPFPSFFGVKPTN